MAFDSHCSTVKFDDLLNYREAQSHAALARLLICFQFVEDLVQPVSINAGAGILNPTLHDATHIWESGANDDLSIRCEFDRIGDEVLEYLAQQPRIGKDRHVGRNFIYQSRVRVVGNRIQVLNYALCQRP